MDIRKLSVKSSELDGNTGRIILPTSDAAARRRKAGSVTRNPPHPVVTPMPIPDATGAHQGFPEPADAESSQDVAPSSTEPPAQTTQPIVQPLAPTSSTSTALSDNRLTIALVGMFFILIPMAIALAYLSVKNLSLNNEVSTLKDKVFIAESVAQERRTEIDSYRSLVVSLDPEITGLREEVQSFTELIASLEFVVDETTANQAVTADLLEDVPAEEDQAPVETSGETKAEKESEKTQKEEK